MAGFWKRLFGWNDNPSDASTASIEGNLARPLPVARDAGLTPRDQPPLRVLRPDEVDTRGGEWWRPRGAPLLAPPPRPAAPIDAELRAQLARVLNAPDLELPRIPQTAQRALQLVSGDSGADYRLLAEVVGADPALSAQVLRMANSAMYRGIREITALDHAFSRIGTRNIRAILLSACAKGLLIKTGGSEKSLGETIWQQSIVSAVVFTSFARRARIDVDEAYLAGLLHDLGMLGLIRIVHDFQRMHGRRVPRPAFDQLALEWHEHIGLRLADEWNLPDPLPMLIGSHHKPPADNDPLRRHKFLVQLSDVVYAMLGYGDYIPYDFFNLPCTRELELRDDPPTREILAKLPEQISTRLKEA